MALAHCFLLGDVVFGEPGVQVCLGGGCIVVTRAGIP
jgi:hypothetical protein